MATTTKFPIAKLIGAVVALMAGLYIAQMTPPPLLTQNAMLGLGIFVFFVIIAMVEVLPDYIGWMLMCTAWYASGIMKFNQAFGFFVNPTWWLVVGAMVQAAAIAKCGLLQRIALAIMTKFPVTYRGQCLSLMAAGTIISPLIPSGTVKCSLMAPLAVSISDLMGFKRGSKGAAGLFNSMFAAAAGLIPAMLSASFINYAIQGALPEDMKVSWGGWLLGSSVWIVLTLTGAYLFILAYYRVDSSQISVTNEELMKQRKALGPMSRDEKITAFVLIVSLILWITEGKLGNPLSATSTVLLGTAVLCTTNVLDRKAFRGSVAWDALIFMGCAISMTTAFPALGIDKWIASWSGDLVVPLLEQNIMLFIVVISLVSYVIRLFMASQTAFVVLFMVFLVPAALAANIHPWVLSFITFTASNIWIVKHQNIQYIPAIVAADTAAGETFVPHSRLLPFALYYAAANIIILILCVPFWKYLGWM